MKRLCWLSCIIGVIFLTGCNVSFFEDPEFNEIVFDPSVAIPLGTATYDIQSLFEQVEPGAIFSNAAGEVVTLVYTESLVSDSANEFLGLLDQQFNAQLPSGTNLSNPGSAVELEVTQSYAVNYAAAVGTAYDSLSTVAGNLIIELGSNLGASTSYELTLSSVEEDGEPLVFSGTISPGTNSILINQDLNEKSIVLHLDENGNVTSNSFLFTLTYRTTIQPGESITASQGVDISIGLNDQVFKEAFGNFGQQSLSASSQGIDVAFFNRFESGSITFANPSIQFNYLNAFGLTFAADYSGISVTESSGQVVSLEGAATSGEQLIFGPDISNMGQSIPSSFVIDNNNSNLVDLLNRQPEQINFALNYSSNPASAPPQYDFAQEESQLLAEVVFQIPFEFNMQDLKAFEELGFNNIDLSRATGLLLRASSNNELPLGGDVELQFLNPDGNIVFVVEERPAFSAAEVEPDGTTSGSAQATTDILLDAEDIEAIEDATRVRLVVRLNTTDTASGDAVKFFNEDQLIFHLAVQVDLKLSSKGN